MVTPPPPVDAAPNLVDVQLWADGSLIRLGLLQHAGLVAALGAFCEEFQKPQPIELTYSADVDVARIEGETALCLYRIAQEDSVTW